MSLDDIVRKAQRSVKAYWKQWIPIYGLHQAIKDYDSGKELKGVVAGANSVYHGICMSALFLGSVYLYLELTDKI